MLENLQQYWNVAGCIQQAEIALRAHFAFEGAQKRFILLAQFPQRQAEGADGVAGGHGLRHQSIQALVVKRFD